MENGNHMPLNLQFFADPAADPANPAANPADPAAGPADPANPENPADPAKAKDDPPKTPSLKELLKDKDFASEFDQHVSKAITTAKTKWDEDAKLTADELAKKKQAEAETALNDREAKLAARELRADILAEIGKRGLPSALIDAVSLADKEAAEASLTAVEKAFRTSVEAGVNEKLKGTPPPDGSGGGSALADRLRSAAGVKPAK